MRRLVLFLVLFLFLGGVKHVSAEPDCQFDLNRFDETKKEVVERGGGRIDLNDGDTFCNLIGRFMDPNTRDYKPGYEVAKCVKNNKKPQSVQPCLKSDGNWVTVYDCVPQNQPGQVMCLLPTSNVCQVFTDKAGVGGTRVDKQRGCMDDGTIGVCDGITGKFKSLSQCASPKACMNLTDSASCAQPFCTDNNGNNVPVGGLLCSGDNVAWCSWGKPKVDDQIGSHKCTGGQKCYVGKDGPTCMDPNERLCYMVNNDTKTVRQAKVGEQICSDDGKNKYICNSTPSYSVVPCGSDEKCIETSSDATCIKNGSPLPPGAKDQTTIDKQNQKGSSTLTMQLSENKGKVFCSSSDKPQPEPEPGNIRVYTAFGCVPATVETFIKWLLPYLFGIAGGISFLLMVFGFIKVATSAGDPKEIEGAKETITSAIIGLVVSIFALFILKLILADILKIPGIS